MKRFVVFVAVIALAALACGSPATPRPPLNLYPSHTYVPTQTPYFVIWTQTPNATDTPVIVVVSETPSPLFYCVSATVAVYLRPSPSNNNYPIKPVPNGAIVRDLGGRDGAWWFVEFDDKAGWVDSAYLQDCR